MNYVWDPRKAALNQQKHGVTFDEACEVFADDKAVIVPDEEHSWEERRFKMIGHSSQNLLLVIYVAQAENVLRLISAREANKRERRIYYED